MTETKTPMPLAERIQYVIDHLDIFQETKDPCSWGHVEHTEADHLGRRLVHTMAAGGGIGLGADWDADSAIEFIRAATDIRRTQGISLGHPFLVTSGGRTIAFAGNEPERR